MASTTLINTADAAELRLVHFLGDHNATSPFVLSCESAIQNSDAAQLLSTIIQHQPAIDRLIQSEEGVGAFSILVTLLDRVPAAQQITLMKALVGSVENSTVDAPLDHKLGCLCGLYNLRSGADKCWILARILNLSAFHGDDEQVLNLLPDRKSTLGNLLQGSNLERLLMGFENGGNQEQRALFSIASKVVGKLAEVCRARDMGKEADAADCSKQRFLLKMLAMYSNLSEVDDEARAAAKQAAVGAICDPVTLFNEQRIIMSLPPVTALKSTDGEIYQLLEIFQQGKLEDFQSFQNSNPSALSNNNISEEDAIRNMRLLSLCSLATEHEEIPYDAIAQTLQVEQSEVENWVISAVSSGLLSAKMDQLHHVVMVERCVVRRFGIEQWKILQERLNV